MCISEFISGVETRENICQKRRLIKTTLQISSSFTTLCLVMSVLINREIEYVVK